MSVKSQEEILAKDKMWEFTSQDKFHIAGRGKAYVVKCPIACGDFDWIIGKDVIIDGSKHKVVAVERFTHMPPWRKGESISLLVAEFGSL